MKKIICFALLLSFHVVSLAQSNELHVDSVYEDDGDNSARGTEKRKYPNQDVPDDGNPAHYQSLLKIQIPLSDAKIEKENAGIVSIEYKTGEIWVWIFNGENQPPEIKIMHKDYLPLAVSLKEHGIATKGMDVFVIKVSAPSAGLKEAERLYNDLKLGAALNAYRDVVNEENAKDADKEFAKKRINLLTENNSLVIRLNNAANKRYMEYKRIEKSASKLEKMSKLKKMYDIYDDLYKRTSIPEYIRRVNKIKKALFSLNGETTFKGEVVFMLESEDGGEYVPKRKKVKVFAYGLKKQTDKRIRLFGLETEIGPRNPVDNELPIKPIKDKKDKNDDIETDELGRFQFTIENLEGFEFLRFESKYDKETYKSSDKELTFDENGQIKGDFGIIRLTKK